MKDKIIIELGAELYAALTVAGDGLRPGDIILSGSLGTVVPALADKQMTVSITGIGNARVRFS